MLIPINLTCPATIIRSLRLTQFAPAVLLILHRLSADAYAATPVWTRWEHSLTSSHPSR